jgi:hypothetical protein
MIRGVRVKVWIRVTCEKRREEKRREEKRREEKRREEKRREEFIIL